MQRNLSDTQRGASLVEYALLLTLISLTCIAVLNWMGVEISDMFDHTSDCINNPGSC